MNIIINTNDDQVEDEILKKKIEMNLKTRESLESEVKIQLKIYFENKIDLSF